MNHENLRAWPLHTDDVQQISNKKSSRNFRKRLVLMMKSKKFFVVNSFAEKPFGGNPAAVFTDGEHLDTPAMQRIAKQLNLVETVFMFPLAEGNADLHLRYFTPAEELPIAGHPTIAAILAYIQCHNVDLSTESVLHIKTNAGVKLIKITQNLIGPMVMMEQPPPQFYPVVTERNVVADLFGIHEDDLIPDLPIQPIDTGLGHLIVPLKSLEALMRAQRNLEPLKNYCTHIGIREAQLFTLETDDSDKDLHTRNICPREGIEDPGCGVGNGALGAYLLEHYYQGRTKIQLKAEQGHITNMPCVIEIDARKENGRMNIFVGGNGKVMIEGVFYLES